MTSRPPSKPAAHSHAVTDQAPAAPAVPAPGANPDNATPISPQSQKTHPAFTVFAHVFYPDI